MLTTPNGTTTTPKAATIHGMVLQRWRPPMSPIKTSSM